MEFFDVEEIKFPKGYHVIQHDVTAERMYEFVTWAGTSPSGEVKIFQYPATSRGDKWVSNPSFGSKMFLAFENEVDATMFRIRFQ